MPAKVAGAFIEPMLLQKTDRLPDDGTRWAYQLKLDGYRAVAFMADGRVSLQSRNGNDFGARYAPVLKGLTKLPADTVIDGEIVALDGDGRPSFNLLQNYGSATVPLAYFVFDVMVLRGRNVMRDPLSVRRRLLETKVLPQLSDPVRYLGPLEVPLSVLVQSAKAQGFEGLVAKRIDSPYEPGLRTGAWQKMRVNRGQEFVIGGYTIGGNPFDALIFGYYEGDRLLYAARTRSGFTPATRAQLFKRFKGLETRACPFENLPEKKSGRWGAGLTAKKMPDCRWLRPLLVGQFEFLEWTGEGHLRHTRFVALRDDKDPRTVIREADAAST
jgi:DNA ligase D-like protein (predicted ligase)